ncbi:Acyl-CoA N-acyltransferase [Ascosphaera apis ARSEF 7405]|uniref:Acyl-CoA N-acyltransferase n=1 Tax=Ascosphaera apis ARSEF 7405 TaxID=392613 RepID=A0A167ZH66_9EURO|nr:Acyl-CoA N-acyltransferase [Ascosphaera apis ARSEF 7405]
MSTSPQLTFAVLPPPGEGLVRPTPDNPNPPSNPKIFNDAMFVRTTVFIDEQHCSPENELDFDDSRSWHWVFYDTQSQQPAGVLRIVPPPHEPHDFIENKTFKEPTRPYIKLGRIALLKEYRGKGLGKFVIQSALDWAAAHPDEITRLLNEVKATDEKAKALTSGTQGEWDGVVLVHAQKVMEPMYAKCGFVTDDSMGTWIEERMVHVGMWQTLKVKKEAETST